MLMTDHRPLTTILGPKNGIPPQAAARMQRWALLLSADTYTIQFRPTQGHGNADGLSRLPLQTHGAKDVPDDAAVFNLQQIESLPVHSAEVAQATSRDPILSKVLICLRRGWPDKVQEALLPYWRKRKELTIEGNCILWGIRVVIPSRLRDKILTELHQGHQGIGRMKSLTRSHVWWPDIDQTLERTAKACPACQEHKNSPSKAPLHPWVWSAIPWDRIHLDFAGPVMGKMLLVIVDSHSKWLEVIVMTNTSANSTITVLREVFSRYGLPKQVVTDNGPQFIAGEFQSFMLQNGIRHIRSSPYHPSSNGAAERMVQSVKKAVYSGKREGEPLEKILARFLLQYRTTAHATTGVPPSSLFMGRVLRTRLDLLKPDVGTRVRAQQELHKSYHDRHSNFRSFDIGEGVWTKNFRDGPPWLKGVIADRLGPVSYLVRMEDGALWRRHVDHLRSGSSDAVSVESRNEDLPDLETGTVSAEASSLSPVPVTAGETGDRSSERQTESGTETSDQASRNRYPSRIRRPPERLYGTLEKP